MIKKIFLTTGAVISSIFLMTNSSFAKECTQNIEAGDALKFNITEIKVAKDCTTLKLTLKHVGKASKIAMGHNWVLTLTKDIDATVKDGLIAGAKSDYLKKGDKKLLAHTKLVGGGETDTISIDMTKIKKGGDYSFFCLFPGHYITMRGKFIY